MPRPKVRTTELRASLLDHAVLLLEQDGPPALRARSVATAAGTSTAALYELFGDKAGLVRAIFLEGFARLHDRLAAVPAEGDPREALLGLLEAARGFAVTNPMLFEVLFARPFAEFEPSQQDRRVAADIHELVLARVSRWVATAGVAAVPLDVAHALLAANRGLVAEELAGVLGSSTDSIERRRSLALGAMLDGFPREGS